MDVRLLITGVAFLAVGCVTVSKNEPAALKRVPTKKYKTAAGEMFAVNDGSQYSLLIGKKIVFQDLVMKPGSPKITKREKVGNIDLFVVERFAGDSCPVANAVIAVHPGGKVTSDRIGNCLQPTIQKGPGFVTFCYSGFEGASYRPQKWTYRDGKMNLDAAAGECGDVETVR